MKNIWTFVLFLSLVNTKEGQSGKSDFKVKGFAGGNIIIKCDFKNYTQHDKEKYFCRVNSKTELIPGPFEARFSQYYNKTNGIFSVLIRNLTSTDSGTYLCGIQSELQRIRVRLNIREDDCCGQSISKISRESNNTEISCSYPKESTNNSKHFCKLTQDSTCSDLIASKTNETRGRFSITHNRDQNLFTVMMRELTSSDSGVYWCGVRTGGMSASMALITEVKLEVKGQPVIIAVCVVVAVIVITAVFVYISCRRVNSLSQDQVSTFSTTTYSSRDTGNKRMPHADCDYEEIMDMSSDPNPAESSSSCISNPLESVYVLTQLPSQPSEDPNYSTTSFHRNPDSQAESGTTATPRRDEMTSEYAVVKKQCCK